MKVILSGTLLLATTATLAQAPSQAPTLGLNTAQKLDELRRLANQAKDAGDLPAETLYLCQAAAIDEKKFGKKCDRVKGDADKALAQFQADLEMGRGDVQRKDYAGALRDLGKIKFGPSKAEAQEWMQQARIGLSGGTPVDPASLAAFNAARAAYDRGDFDAVEPEVRRIQSPVIQAGANQFLANICAYRDAMKQADAMAHAGDLKGAEQKYQVAVSIQRNGPGHPQDRLHEVQAAEAKAAAAASSQSQSTTAALMPSNEKATPPPAKPNHAARNRNTLITAHQGATNNDVQASTQANNAPGNLAAQQTTGLAGTAPAADETQKSGGIEDSLKAGIADFYASHFSHAAETIGLYLLGDEKQHAGAAHFYLGASLFAQALLASPKDEPRVDALQRQAQDQFTLAKQLHYKPIESAVSPKILAQWTQTGEQ